MKRNVPILALASSFLLLSSCQHQPEKPNLIYVFADQWRAQATGYAGDPNVLTPNLDLLSQESVQLSNAVSTMPVCTPYRASMLTGQYPLTNGIFYNDKPLPNKALTIAEVYKKYGYQTAYIGKWHLNGGLDQRSAYIPPERRQGFDFWKVLECTHDYNNSYYYGDENKKLKWEGYDAIAQTREAIKYIEAHKKGAPFILFLSWGPPHNPYQTAPEKYKRLYQDTAGLVLRGNVPADRIDLAKKELSGYYAHIAALDDCMGMIMNEIEQSGLKKSTILVFTSDHGDMLQSHAEHGKQVPYDESIKVPFLIRYPDRLGQDGRVIDMPIGTPDIMPTLLGLSGIPVPETVEGKNYADVLTGDRDPDNEAELITCVVPFHVWNYHRGGKEYRGIRTRRYTYVEDLKGPWLMFDDQEDPYQMHNLANLPEYSDLQKQLKEQLKRKLAETHDEFLPGTVYMKRWNYQFDGNDAPDK